jgi:hypothetical protein
MQCFFFKVIASALPIASTTIEHRSWLLYFEQLLVQSPRNLYLSVSILNHKS